MTGGTIIGIARGAESTLVHVEGSRPHVDRCSIRVRENGVELGLGDVIWWQERSAYWTPKGSKQERQGIDFDIKVERVGYSH